MVAIVGAGALDKAVIEVVVDRRRQDPIQSEDAGMLIELVLVATTARDLDDDLNNARKLVCRLHPATIPRRRRHAGRGASTARGAKVGQGKARRRKGH